MGTDTGTKFAAFCNNYVGNIQEEYMGCIGSTRALLERKTDVVTSGKQQLAKAAAAITASGANNGEQRTQLTTILAQLVKTDANVARANDRLETLQTEKEAKEAGARDPDNVDSHQNIKLKTDNNITI